MTQLLMASGNPLLVVDAADFDGTNDYMARGADLSGNADSKTGIISAWLRMDVDQSNKIVTNTLQRFNFEWSAGTDNHFYVWCKDTANATNLRMHSTTAYIEGATWLHALASWDLAAGASHLYVNDVSDKTIDDAAVNSNIDYTGADWAIGAAVGGATKYSGCLADLYVAPGQYLDFSLVANRRRFISASGKPVHLGATGSLPTGTAPLVYHHLDDGEAVANFATNRGTGGNFTITGTLDTASTSPSG